MELVQRLIRASRRTDVRDDIVKEAQDQVERIKDLVNDLCFEEQRMSSCGAEYYQKLRKEVGLDD